MEPTKVPSPLKFCWHTTDILYEYSYMEDTGEAPPRWEVIITYLHVSSTPKVGSRWMMLIVLKVDEVLEVEKTGGSCPAWDSGS